MLKWNREEVLNTQRALDYHEGSGSFLRIGKHWHWRRERCSPVREKLFQDGKRVWMKAEPGQHMNVRFPECWDSWNAVCDVGKAETDIMGSLFFWVFVDNINYLQLILISKESNWRNLSRWVKQIKLLFRKIIMTAEEIIIEGKEPPLDMTAIVQAWIEAAATGCKEEKMSGRPNEKGFLIDQMVLVKVKKKVRMNQVQEWRELVATSVISRNK